MIIISNIVDEARDTINEIGTLERYDIEDVLIVVFFTHLIEKTKHRSMGDRRLKYLRWHVIFMRDKKAITFFCVFLR